MRSLFWLQQQQQPSTKGGCKAPTNTSLVDPMTAAALKAAKEVNEEATIAAASLSLPICTALSPSARSLKIPISASAVPVNKCLPNNGSKRGSLDSGYADSTNDSNIGIEDEGGETHAHHHHYFDGQCCQLEQTCIWKVEIQSLVN